MAKSVQKNVTVAKSNNAPTFQWKTSADLGPFKAGEFLSKPEHIAEYGRQMLLLEDGQTKEGVAKLTDVQVVAVAKSINREGLSDDDADIAMVAALLSVGSEDDNPLTDNTIPLSAIPPGAASAIKYGHMITPEFEDVIDKGVEGKRDYDGSPILGEASLVEIFGKMKVDGTPVMDTWPMIGSRKQGGKNDNVGKDFNGPVDFYVTINRTDGKENKGRWLSTFVDTMPKGAARASELSQCRTLLKGQEVKNLTPRLAAAGNKNHILKDLEADIAAERTAHINRVGRAILFYQQKRRIELELPMVRVRLSDTDIERAAKRNKPITLCAVEDNNGEREIVPSPAISLTKFLSLKVNVAKARGGDCAALSKSNDRGKKKEELLPPSSAPAIPNAAVLGDYLSAAFNYLDSKETYNLVMHAIAKPDGGELASRIIYIYDALSTYGTNANVRALATAFDKVQVESSAAKAIAQTENKAP